MSLNDMKGSFTASATLQTAAGGRDGLVRMLTDTGHTVVAALTAREREVLGLVAQGLSNSVICADLVLAPASVEKQHPRQVDLPPSDDTHRRVRAVLAYLNH